MDDGSYNGGKQGQQQQQSGGGGVGGFGQKGDNGDGVGGGNNKVKYTMPGVLHFIQHEWSNFELERSHWEIDRAELQVSRTLLSVGATHVHGHRCARRWPRTTRPFVSVPTRLVRGRCAFWLSYEHTSPYLGQLPCPVTVSDPSIISVACPTDSVRSGLEDHIS